MNNIVLLSGNSNIPTQFANSEIRCKIVDELRGKNIL